MTQDNLSSMVKPLKQSHASLRKLWGLQSDVSYLNHGSFGATPKAILAYQRSIQEEMEAEPVQFMVRILPERLWAVQQRLGQFVSAKASEIVLIDNATTGVNQIFASLEFETGDEVLFVDQVYGACRKTAQWFVERSGGRCLEIPLPRPVVDPEEIVEHICRAWTPRCKLLLLDHICSPTGWILPIEKVVRFYEERGTPVLVDGAHALGQIPLNLSELGASYYVANAHKWLCTPKGSAMLYVRKDRQHEVHPANVSHWFDWDASQVDGRYSRFQMSHSWTGTRDPSAVLTIPFALEWMGDLHEDGWAGLQYSNTSRAKSVRSVLLHTFQGEANCPEEMMGHMGSLLLPSTLKIPVGKVPVGQTLSPLWAWMFDEHQIEVVCFPVEQRTALRYSIQAYVTDEDVQRLVEALQLLVV